MKYLTLEQVQAKRPCRSGMIIARRIFGKRKKIAISVKLARTLSNLPYEWLARHLLSASSWNAFLIATDQIARRCDVAVGKADNKYTQAMKIAWRRCARQSRSMWPARYARILHNFETAYRRAQTQCRRDRAAAFARAFLQQHRNDS